MKETKAAKVAVEEMEARDFQAGEAIDLAARLEPENKGEPTIRFIGPKAAGKEVIHGGREILILTRKSPWCERWQAKK